MRIVIDMQGAQTESRFRGIGRYTLSLAQAIVRNRGEHEIILALSGLFPDTIEPIRAAFDGLLPQENIRVWYAPGPVRECEPGNDWRREVAERIREAFLASLRPDVVHIASLFEGYVDDAVTSIGVFAPQIPTVVTVHNLIPLLNPETYLKPDPAYALYYQRKVEHLKRAYQFLAISESAAGEARDTLAIPAESVIITYEGCDAIFRRMKITEHEKQKLLTRFGITQPFVLYSGGADARKNLHRLIRAYARLPKLLRDAHQLMLVGKMPEGEVAELWQTAKSGGISEGQLLFTGYVTDEELAQFYNLCTVFVFPSLHEGFGLPALEAMSCGAAVIGANTTSIPEVIGRQDALFDPYDKAAISQKLAQVLGDAAFRAELAAHGLEQAGKFSWDASARRAIAAFERLHSGSAVSLGRKSLENLLPQLIQTIASSVPYNISNTEMLSMAHSLSQVYTDEAPKQLFVDISGLVQHDARTGIQRVTRSILKELLESPPEGYVVEPVCAATDTPGYRYARRFTASFCGLTNDLYDEPIDYRSGDIFLGLDLQHDVVSAQKDYLAALRRVGVKVFFVVHDLLPITLPHCFLPGTDVAHKEWIRTLAKFDGVVCVSRTVANEFREWLTRSGQKRAREFKIVWSHNGADIEGSVPTRGLPDKAVCVLAELARRPTFLTVGTVEPRKGQAQVLGAFELFWKQGVDANLVIVGKQGWMVDQLAERLRRHPELNKRLFWLEGISDEYLEKIYAASTCLIAASEGEGFGLPLIEAAQHKLPIIARDIPVFREVTGECAYYFSGKEPSDLALAISEWLNLYTACQHPTSEAMPWLTWKESARQLLIGIGIEPDKGKVWRPIEVAYPDRPVGNATAGGDVALDAGRGRSQEMLSPIRGHWTPPMRIFVDCTHTYTNCMNTGIQRVVRNFVRHTTALGPSLGMLCEPVIFRNGAILPLGSLDGPSLHQPRHTLRGYLRRAYLATTHRIAVILHFPPLQRFLLALFFPMRLLAWLRGLVKSDQPSPKGIEGALGKGDILFLPDDSWSGDVFGLLARVKAKGGRVVFFVHDIIPLTHPQVCHPVHVERFREWFGQAIRIADFLIYNSLFTQQSITDYLNQRPGTPRPAGVVAHLGYDLGPLPTGDIRHGNLRSALTQSPASFLCVGTLEPRKNLSILIDAFEALWNDGHEVSLILIGRASWLRDKILVRIRRHPELGRRLFWFNDVGDTDLALAYRQASALIFPSIVEGFGLPLVEALSQGLPVIASDIPVFREIAGDHGRFFPPHDAEALASAVKEHLAASPTAGSSTFRWPTWEESSRQLLIALRTFFDGTLDRD